MDIDTTAFFSALLASPSGRAHMLSVTVDAEEGDESGVFEQVAEMVEDPRHRRIVERHADDEVRHALLFRECLARNGFDKQTVPEELMVVRQAAARSGAPSDGAGRLHDLSDIVTAYALLLAIEERGVAQYPKLADAFEPHDPETAQVYRRVVLDERGHVRYCQRIGRHHAGDDHTWQEAVTRARAIEQEAFLHAGMANMAYCTAQGWLDTPSGSTTVS